MSDRVYMDLVDGKMLTSCSIIHPGPCIAHWLKEALRAFFISLKFYIPLYVLSVLARYKQLLSQPKVVLKSLIKSCIRSSFTLATMAFLGKIGICGTMYLQGGRVTPNLLVVSSFLAPHAALIESTARVSEIALYLMPRFFEALGNFLARRNLPHSIPNVLVFASGMSAIMYSSQFETELVKPMYRNLCSKFFGKN